MGTRKRYADSVDRQMDIRILERIAAQGDLQTLTPAELELDRLPVTIDPQPKKGRVWVRFGTSPIQVDADICRWTDRAVGIRLHIAGRELRCWVWTGAVTTTP